MLTKADMYNLKNLREVYLSDLEQFEAYKLRAGEGSENDHQAFNIGMIIYHLEKASNYLSVIINPDATIQVDLDKIYAYSTPIKTEDFVNPNKPLENGICLYDENNDEWIVTRSITAYKNNEHVPAVDIKTTGTTYKSRWCVPLSELRGWRFNPWKDDAIDQMVLEIIKGSTIVDLYEPGFIGWICAEVTKKMNKTKNPIKVIEKVYEIIYDKDFVDRLNQQEEVSDA